MDVELLIRSLEIVNLPNFKSGMGASDESGAAAPDMSRTDTSNVSEYEP